MKYYGDQALNDLSKVPFQTLVDAFTAVRTHPKLGKGSCSSVDECWDDSELREHILMYFASAPGRTVETLIKKLEADEVEYWAAQGIEWKA